ncbi:MAG: hypothetical protein IBGAMO2_760008 [Arenicellales bacterium IbO2]|nr:MAG: hypothetical protein IBGAMO2_760008 [Arenicellales bacterium IbO2]
MGGKGGKFNTNKNDSQLDLQKNRKKILREKPWKAAKNPIRKRRKAAKTAQNPQHQIVRRL